MGTGENQENVMFLASGVTVKFCGGPVGAEYKYKGAYVSTSSIRQLLLVCCRLINLYWFALFSSHS